jgi:hypothetical protein
MFKSIFFYKSYLRCMDFLGFLYVKMVELQESQLGSIFSIPSIVPLQEEVGV